MTIALAIRVNDGLVLAADSASTLTQTDLEGNVRVVNVYNNANKVVNLHRRLPISAMTWGLGEIDGHSISTLFKDLRSRFEGEDLAYLDWKLDVTNYNLHDVAAKVKHFFVDELMSSSPNLSHYKNNRLGLFVGGFSSGSKISESFLLNVHGDECIGPESTLLEAGAIWDGQREAITRLLLGFSANIEGALTNLGVSKEDAPIYVQQLKAQTAISLIPPSMPIKDAIELAEFLVETTIKFSKYSPGSNTVGGPIEIAAITQHEGFKWITRKLYYPLELNG
jgi:hypothetical protein